MLDRVGTFDAYQETQQERAAFAKIRNSERYYGAQLRKIANAIETLVNGMQPDNAADLDTLQRILERYSDLLRPWARSVARRMLADVERRDRTAWIKYSRFMGVTLRHELLNTPIGEDLNLLMDQQVNLITSLPLEAARRVHDIAIGNLYGGERASEIVKQIMLTGQVTKARANLIARTETSRASTMLTMARAKQIGSTGYIWRSSRDYKVRPELGIRNFAKLNTLPMGSHRKLDGTFHAWTDPPIADPSGVRAHPGAIYNCRCYAEPVLPDQYI
jgi:SPP1 gp7 family putative phage head morphogenesis protein